MLTATFGTFGSMVGFVDNPYTTTTAQAATAGNDGAGRYWVKNMVMHTTGKEMNSWQGRLSSVLGKARKVTISKYGKVQANKKYTPLHHNHEVVCIFYYDLKIDCKKEIVRTSSDTSRC